MERWAAGLLAVLLGVGVSPALGQPVPQAPVPAAPAPSVLPLPPPPNPGNPAAARPPLVAELSQERVDITTGFSGTDLLVFGATERLLGDQGVVGGDDVLVVAQSAPEPMIVRRKINVLGFWINGPSARFRQVPGFYLLTGTRPLRDVLEPEEREAKRLGLDQLPLQAFGIQDEDYREALMKLKQDARLWHEEDEPIQISGARLFRARLPLPATTGTGDYQVQVLLVRGGRVVARQELGFRVERVGTAARIADVATEQPMVYGAICILLAAFAGWLGSVLFRRG
ncbi:TIGR02186 family protein [Pseudoroseomonas globiformis]|uniref:TIGR02186 family protein n=1 Tax=Teichococcus globiformis TaxID=2307229 RepID=A0ABV7FYG7_9PROT